jgi:hypothetical protein
MMMKKHLKFNINLAICKHLNIINVNENYKN